jgi:hypothetical protein
VVSSKKMGKIRRGNYIFLNWVGDHSPRHVHVYKSGKFIGKWNLEKNVILSGKLPKKVIDIIKELQKEGRL